MTHITFSNGDKVCTIGQGTWNMGRNPLCEKSEANALLTGIDLGMNIIDTAEMYGNEKFIGKVIKSCRDKVFLVSKVHPDNADYQGTIKACEESLRRLGTETLDLYLLHWKSRYPLSETVEADAIILGSSTYSADVSSTLKAVIERASVVSDTNPGMFRHKIGGAVAVARRAGAMNTIDSINHFFLNKEMFVAGSTYWNIAYGCLPGEALNDDEAVATMKNLGQNIAWFLSH